MRGKLRDKRTARKHDEYSRDGFERRRPYKRDARSVQRVNQPGQNGVEADIESDIDELDEELEEDMDDEDNEDIIPQFPRKK